MERERWLFGLELTSLTSATVLTTRQRHLSWRYSLSTHHLLECQPGCQALNSLSLMNMGHPGSQRQVHFTNGKLSLKTEVTCLRSAQELKKAEKDMESPASDRKPKVYPEQEAGGALPAS